MTDYLVAAQYSSLASVLSFSLRI